MKRLSFSATFGAALLMTLSACSLFVPDSDISTPPPDSSVAELPAADEPTVSTALPPKAPGDSVVSTLSAEIVNRSNETVGAQYPAFLESEVVGRNISKIVNLAGTYESDGRRRLINYEELWPNPNEGQISKNWPDGVHEFSQFWQANGNYLTDGDSGDFVILRKRQAVSGDHEYVRGRLRLDNGNSYVAAELIFSDGLGQPTRIIDTLTGESLELGQAVEFQTMDLVIQGDGSLAPEPGARLLADNISRLNLEQRPLPSGRYFTGLIAESDSGVRASAFADHDVINEGYLSGLQAYFDPHNGFQFLYPADWAPPSYEEGRLNAASQDGSMALSITVHPGIVSRDVQLLKSRTINSFGPIQILYEEDVTVGGESALWTVYGYEAHDGSHTGVFLILAGDNTGYVIDIDGPAAEEARTLEVGRLLADNWKFRSTGYISQIGRWTREHWADYSVAIPSHYQQEEMEGGWRKFSSRDGNTFLGLLLQSSQTADTEKELAYWQEIAGQGVEGFNASEIYNLTLADKEWTRVDFSYVNNPGTEIWGAIMSTKVAGGQVVTWIEAPSTIFYETEQSTFQIMLADIRLSQ